MDLIKKPINIKTGKEYQRCSKAFFADQLLRSYEPDIVVKIYDSLKLRHDNTGVIFTNCNDSEALRAGWEYLGKPELICSCLSSMKTINEKIPEIKTVSLYKVLVDYAIGGGCNKADYCFWNENEHIKVLAEDMGVKIQPMPESNSINTTCSYITSDISSRNMLKSKGCHAVHILELIYGPGQSNADSSLDSLSSNLMDLNRTMLSFFWDQQ